ncbi:MAG: glycosyltransferase [bacterium]|nr:glycosyltransferase [bacterium]
MKILLATRKTYIEMPIIYDFADAFEDLGHKTEVVDINEYNKIFEENEFIKGLEIIKRKIRDISPDFAICYGSIGIFPKQLIFNKKIGYFSYSDVPLASLYYDNPCNELLIPYVESTKNHRINHIFVWDKVYLNILNKEGYKNVSYLPLATNPKRYKKLKLEEDDLKKYECEIGFVGTYSGHRHKIMSMLKHHDIKIYGINWERSKDEDVRKRFYGEIDNLTETTKFYNATKININSTIPEGITSINTRLFDVLASEGFILTDYKDDLNTLFDIKEEIISYTSIEQIPKLCELFLKHPEQRRLIAQKGRRRVLREHTYKQRAAVIIDVMKNYI